ncbi:MAG: OmpH family outer membrane protein [Planctomycetota bacterium]|nr:OmpH family outer membrane protein [Planctomycetota bacterium]MDA1261458.1 OmpH family outer membrane protein [Planctomycetota bacterium]
MKKTSFIVAVLIASTCVAGSAAFTIGRLSAQPSAVGNVDIRRIMDKIQQRGEMEIELTQMSNRFEQELKTRKEQIESRAKESDAVTDPAERQSLRDGLAFEQLQLKEWATIKQMELDGEQARRWENLYRSIVGEADKLAQSEGYQYVLVYDGTSEFQRDRRSQMPLSQQVVEQISRRRVLYAAKADDLTEKLIQRMNNSRATPTAAVAPVAAP